jgi:hypothetical protein
MENISTAQTFPFIFVQPRPENTRENVGKSTEKNKNYLLFFGGLGQQTAQAELQNRYPDKHLLVFDPHFYAAGRILERSEIQLCLSNLFAFYQIQTFTLVGYSLGSRLAVEVARLFPERVEKLTLLAPDGILPNFWYRIATSFWGRPFFQQVLKLEKKKQFLSKLIFLLLSRFKKLDPLFSSLQGILFFLQSEKKVQALENQWLLYAKIMARSNRQKLFPLAKNRPSWQDFETELIVAERDELLPVKKFRKWQKKRPYLTLKIIKTNHLGLWKRF